MNEDSTSADDRSELFALVGNELRMQIIERLGDLRVEAGVQPTLSYAELRSRAAPDVTSSQFNYHLQKLCGSFVERVDEGYRMRVEGRLVYQAIRSGTFARATPESAHGLDTDCYYCGGEMELQFEDSVARVWCRECEELYDIMGVPPVVTDEESDAVERFADYSRSKRLSFARGSCPTCGNAVARELTSPPELPYRGTNRDEWMAYCSCTHCGDQLYLTVGELLLAEPAVIAFYHAHGRDLFEIPAWALEWAATDRRLTVDDTDTRTFVVEVDLEDDRLTVELDADLDVTGTERTSLG
mgnify:FL=1